MAKNKETSPGVTESGESNKFPHSFGCYIHKVPENLRCNNVDKYESQTVSIGPYYHGKPMEITEDHKKWYLKEFLNRSKVQKTVWKDVVNIINGIQGAARKCYLEDLALDDEDFSKMLILDGCFILELLCRYHEHKHQLIGVREDNIFDRTWLLSSIRCDLVLLENQVPFGVLVCLFDLIHSPLSGKYPVPKKEKPNYPIPPSSLGELIASFFNSILPTTISADEKDSSYCGHLLEMLRMNLLSSPRYMTRHMTKEDEEDIESETKKDEKGIKIEMLHATSLEEAGTKFEKMIHRKGLIDIKFVDRSFAIPPFHFGESWTVLLRNIIALEQCCRHKKYKDRWNDEITSYVILMNNILSSHEDVKLFRDKGIISSMEEDGQIALEISNLCKDVTVNSLYYAGLRKEVQSYLTTSSSTLRASFMRLRHTRWGGVFIVAASCLLWLATLRTVLTLLSLIHSPTKFVVIVSSMLLSFTNDIDQKRIEWEKSCRSDNRIWPSLWDADRVEESNNNTLTKLEQEARPSRESKLINRKEKFL